MEMQTKLSFSVIFDQTCNFIRKRITQFALVSLVIALVSAIIHSSFYAPEMLEQLYLTQNLDNYFLFLIMTMLINIIIKAMSIAAISNLYVSDKLNPNLLLSKALSNTLKIILFYLIVAISIVLVAIMSSLVIVCLSYLLPKALVYIFVILMLIVPILFLGIFSNFFFGLLVEPHQKNFFELLSLALDLSTKQWKPALIMILIGIALIFAFLKIGMLFDNDNIIFNVIFEFGSIFLSIFFTCFFYRLYWLATGASSSELSSKNNDEHNLII